MCGEVWGLWPVLCYVVVGLCVAVGWAVESKLIGMVIK